MDKFFTVAECERCGKTLSIRIMSMMNTDALCEKCDAEEKKHPRYVEARDKENEELAKGNTNYGGLFAGQKYPFNKI